MTEAPNPEQLELDLEFPTPTHYTVKLSKGAVGALETIRSFDAKTDEDALNLVDGLRDLALNRNNVTWQFEEVNAEGILYGLAPGGVVFEISVVPPLGTLS